MDENNEIVVNEETVDETENANSKRGLNKAVIIGVPLIAGALAYRFVVKPIRAKIKAKKNEQDIIIDEKSDEATDIK